MPATVSTVLQQSGNNRKELDSVLNHYKNEGNAEKLQAAYFLISNMGDKFSYDGEVVKNFDPLFRIIDSLRKKKVRMQTESPVVKAKWDSLVILHGFPRADEADSVKDYTAIKAKYIIDNIDEAYKTWKAVSWSKNITFEQFCEYILPYRAGNERLEEWRKYLNDEYRTFRDTITYHSSYELAVAINKKLRKELALNHTIDNYPFSMTAKQMEQARLGACKHLVFYEAMVMRANGIPVSIELAPLWGNINRGHEWLSLIMADGKRRPFDAAQEAFVIKTPYRFSKAFRYSFAAIPQSISNAEDIPPALLNEHLIDVTAEYTTTHDVIVSLRYKSPNQHRHAVICTFEKKWKPQAWGTINNNTAQFTNIGGNLVYNVMYYDHGHLIPATDPFIVDQAGVLHFFKTGEKSDMTLARKFPNSDVNITNEKAMVTGKFQGANRRDFSDAVDFYQIKTIPDKFDDIAVQTKQKFRYVRYLTGQKHKTNLAELEFYGLRGTDTVKLKGAVRGAPEIAYDIGTLYQNAFDGKPETYFSGDKDSVSWAGLDLEKAEQIVKIRYCPRSDTNFILPGDTYELFVWQTDKWISLGKQTAYGSTITFKTVPANQLYLLHNIARGKEERIFTYQNGKQVWW